MPVTKKGYLVINPHRWSALSVKLEDNEGETETLRLNDEDFERNGGPSYFCPVFMKRTDAMKYSKGLSQIVEIDFLLPD